MMSNAIDLLAIAAHPDDVELTCGGSLVKAARDGCRTGIIDLTRGEMGTRGTAETRAAAAAAVMGVSERLNAGLPDAGIHNTDASRRVLVPMIRQLKPRVVILPFPVGCHPDHRIGSELGRDACLLSGLKNYPAEGEAHKLEKILYALAYREDPVKPSFVADISDEFDVKIEAIKCYASQFDAVDSAGEIFPTGQQLYELVRTQNAHYGSLIRTAYGEPFMTHETVRIHGCGYDGRAVDLELRIPSDNRALVDRDHPIVREIHMPFRCRWIRREKAHDSRSHRNQLAFVHRRTIQPLRLAELGVLLEHETTHGV